MKNLASVSIVVGLAIIAGIGVLLFAPGSRSTQQNNGPVIAATIYPIYDIAQAVAGDAYNVELLLPPGTSPHTFDPTPAQIRDIQGADTIFMIGNGLDEWAADIAAQAGSIPTVTVDRGITILETVGHDDHDDEKEEKDHDDHDGDHHDEHEDDHHDEHGNDDHDEHGDEHHDEEGHDHDHDEEEHDDHKEDGHHEDEDGHDHGHEGHSHGPNDPHYWLDPRNAGTIAETIAMELGELMPEEKDAFMARAEAFTAEVDAKTAMWLEAVEPIEGKAFITLHDAFYYLADFATLELVATFEPFPGREPTPQYLAELTEEIEEHNVTALFSEPQLSVNPIESFAADNGITIGVLDPLGGIDERQSYIDLIDFNINALVETLQ